jgi:integrase
VLPDAAGGFRDRITSSGTSARSARVRLSSGGCRTRTARRSRHCLMMAGLRARVVADHLGHALISMTRTCTWTAGVHRSAADVEGLTE